MCLRLFSILTLCLHFYACNGDPGLFKYTIKYIYVTNSVYTGKLGGISGADAKCRADSNYPGTGTYKALLADGTFRVASLNANAGDGQVDWVLLSNNDYYRLDDKKFIFTANSKDLFSFGSLTFDNSFNSGFPDDNNIYWSGINASGGWITASDCTKWESTSGSGTYGEVNKTNASAIGVVASTELCNILHHLVCVEQ
jgi:hypothetical protein